MDTYSITSVADHAITVSFGSSISHQRHDDLLSINAWMLGNPFEGLLDIIVAYQSLTIVYDVPRVRRQSSSSAATFVREWIAQAVSKRQASNVVTRQITIPVCYDEALAPDMKSVEAITGLSRNEIIALHTSTLFRVYMIGFLPGFPYMGEVPSALHVPRRATPRQQVAMGSVGLAGVQTGIYPVMSPGGWQIIGRTPLAMFDPSRDFPALLAPGDKVQFVSIDRSEFESQVP